MQTYWITGASSGIGEALAEELAQAGHQLILTARNAQKLEELRNRLKHPERIKMLPFDLKKAEEAPAVVARALQLFGKIDCLILNAGLSQRSLVEETKMEVYRELMEVNYFGNIALTKAMLPSFVTQNSGHFVVISSLVGKFGTPYRSGYSASKHALHGYFDSLRAELMMKQQNIDVTIICPGFVSTNISYNALGGEGSKVGSYDEANAQGLTPKQFARKALAVIEDRKYEAYIGGKETLGVHLKRFLPSLFVKKIAKAKVR